MPDRKTMTSESDFAIIRAAYAKQVMAAADTADERVEAAFEVTRREDYLGPGPWPIIRFGGQYVDSPSADPVYLYTDDLIGILPDRHLNNGQPSLHARLMSSLGVQPGEHVVHVAAGVGYFSALLAHLVGVAGRVTAIEFEPELALRAAVNMAHLPQARVLQGDGATVPFDPADVIYVNAGVTRPADAWLDRLRDGGRLLLMLTTEHGDSSLGFGTMRRHGAVFVITRDGDGFKARWVSPVGVYRCHSLREAVSEQALDAAFAKDDGRGVTRLYRSDDIAEARCWLKAPGWCLAYD